MAFVRGSKAVLVALFCFVGASTAHPSIQAAVSRRASASNAGTSTLSRYPGYTTLNGALNVTGTVTVTADGEAGLTVTYSLSGLAASFSGGLSIHTGTTCNANASVGGTYYRNLGTDPWSRVSYTSDAEGTRSTTTEP